MTGVLLYILNNFDIMSTNRIIIFSLFLILAIGFLFLFLNDFSEKVFLVVSIVLILPGYTSLLFYDSFEWIRFSASICRTILNLWQFLLIIIGVGVLTDRRTWCLQFLNLRINYFSAKINFFWWFIWLNHCFLGYDKFRNTIVGAVRYLGNLDEFFFGNDLKRA